MTMRPSEAPDPVVGPTTGVPGAATAPAAAVDSDPGGWFNCVIFECVGVAGGPLKGVLAADARRFGKRLR